MSEQHAPAAFGRVDDDGTVWLREGDTERSVGQIPDSTKEEALAFYVRRYENLATEVQLLETRVTAQSMSPEEAAKAIKHQQENIRGANAVGDLAALLSRLEALEAKLPEQIEARRAARAQAHAEAIAAKEQMVSEAESLAAGTDWRGGVDRFRDLLEEWKTLPRVDKATDNELWRRFSSARTQYTRRRKAHFAQLSERRDEAKRLKEAILAEAEPLATSTDWGATAGAFRDLMQRWKAAGSARRQDDDALWQRFRAIQDQFFDARSAAMSQVEGEQGENLQAKTALVDEVTARLEGVTDIDQAKTIQREFLTKFNEIGHVPRGSMRDLDQKVRRINDAVAKLEADEWRRTDPEARERANSTVSLFAGQVSKLEQELEAARAQGNERKAKDLAKQIDTYNALLNQAKATLAEFER